MPIPVTRRMNLHTLDCYGHPLGVECECSRRALIDIEKLGAAKGDMTELLPLKFVCSFCGSRAWKGWLFVKREDADAWLAAGPIVSNSGGRPTF